jgi:phage terminase large subunit-like protein
VPFKQELADAACSFFIEVLRHTADDWWGEPFKLCAWQEEALCRIFGDVDNEDRHVIELVYLEVPQKAGKTEFAAGLAQLGEAGKNLHRNLVQDQHSEVAVLGLTKVESAVRQVRIQPTRGEQLTPTHPCESG